MGLGDPGELPAGSPGGYAEEEQRVRAQEYGPPPEVTVPSEVRFDHGMKTKGRVKRYCFAATASRRYTAALVVDLTEDEAPTEDLKQHSETAVLRDSDNLNSGTRTTHDRQTC